MEPGEGKFVLGVQNMLNPNSFGNELLDIIHNHFVKIRLLDRRWAAAPLWLPTAPYDNKKLV